MKKICMLIPYFGKFPKWFNLYLYSCSNVKNIDFFYFTDCEIPSKIYSNTFFIKISYKDYCNLVSEKLNVTFSPSSPYFLVNIKPFLGIIHDNIVRKYTFWGYSDIDLVYGNLSELLSDDNLKKYDLITTHSERVAGHFTIIRTDSKYSKLAFKIRDWKNRISHDTNYIDEGDFSILVFPYFVWIRRLWKYFFSKYLSSNDKYYFYQKIYQLIHSKALFLECYTSPIPQKRDVWTYDLKTSTIYVPNRFENKKYLGGETLTISAFSFF